MSEQNGEAKSKLITLLKEKRVVLMVGAGSSKFAGFPSWNELLDELRKVFGPSSSLPLEINTYLAISADQIKDKIEREGRIREYHKLLERTFQPKSSCNHTDFHRALVQLGFSGIVTTNYDIVLETAIGEAFSVDRYWRCDSIDLCSNSYPYRVFDFLRSLSPNSVHRWVLHIHGCYNYPEGIILTHRDYLRAYGELVKNEVSNPGGRILDTFHRKVIWALLTMHSFLFVGFSMKDDFFIKMLDIIQIDFELDSEPVHYALMPYTLEDDMEKTSLLLRRKGVWPLFYHVPEIKNPKEAPDHKGLEKLVFELADSLNIAYGSPGIVDITRKMMER